MNDDYYDRCSLCEQQYDSKVTMHMILNQALYMKYSQSQNYFYTKDINILIKEPQSIESIRFQYDSEFIQYNENLRRLYQIDEVGLRVKYMCEYYKYHNEIPRMFFLPLSDLMGRYFDKVRSFNYKRIRKIIQNQQPILNDQETDTLHSKTYNQMSKSIQILNTFFREMSVHKTINYSVTIQDIQKCLVNDKENQNNNYMKLEQIDSNFDFESRFIDQDQNKNIKKLIQNNQIKLQKQKLQKLSVNRQSIISNNSNSNTMNSHQLVSQRRPSLKSINYKNTKLSQTINKVLKNNKQQGNLKQYCITETDQKQSTYNFEVVNSVNHKLKPNLEISKSKFKYSKKNNFVVKNNLIKEQVGDIQKDERFLDRSSKIKQFVQSSIELSQKTGINFQSINGIYKTNLKTLNQGSSNLEKKIIRQDIQKNNPLQVNAKNVYQSSQKLMKLNQNNK